MLAGDGNIRLVLSTIIQYFSLKIVLGPGDMSQEAGEVSGSQRHDQKGDDGLEKMIYS